MKSFFTRFLSIFRKSKRETELDVELSTHLQLHIDDNLKQGMSPEAARKQAIIKLGGIEQTKQLVHDQQSLPFLESLFQDVRYSTRLLRKSPAFTTIAILTLALGIGANSALFSAVNAVLLNPLPYPDPNSLTVLFTRASDGGFGSISYPNFLDWRRENRSFSAIAAFREENFNLTGMGNAERLSAEMVSAEFFPIFGVNPILGRNFTPDEDHPGQSPVALISEGLWKRKFAGSPAVVGQTMQLNNTAYTITGVIPANFHYINDNFSRNAEVYVPIGQYNDPLFLDRQVGMGMDAVGRIKPGVTLAQAKADMDSIAANLAKVYPKADKDSGIGVFPMKEKLVGDVRSYLLVLLAAVGFVLLIACANVANLLLARAMARSREFAIRTAIGATPGRVFRQLLTESVLLSLAGGALGLLLAWWGTQAALKALPSALPRSEEIHLDARVLLFTFAASLICGILFGLVPGLRSSRTDIQETLKEGGRGGSGSSHRSQTVFVAAQMALAVVLLVGAGLMLRSLSKLWDVNPGFDPRNVVSFNFATPQPLGNNPDSIRSGFQRLEEALHAVPGVEAVSLALGSSPLVSDAEVPLWLDGEPKPSSQADMKESLFYVVQPDYLHVMKIPLKRGRFLTDSDTPSAATVIVIDEEFAKRFFPNTDPLGKRVHLDIINRVAEIVGIVGHIKQYSLDSDSNSTIQAQFYLHIAQLPDSLYSVFSRGGGVMLRSTTTPTAVMRSVSEAVSSFNNQMVVYGTEPMTTIISDSFAQKRFAMALLAVFAALAVLLSSIGIYGVISYLVGQRTHEIGIRMALGAQRGNVVAMVLAQAGKMIALGIAIGLLSSAILSRLMSSMLFNVSPTDPLTLATVPLLLIAVSLLACYIPAYRASHLDPASTLRSE